ncbi:WD repeat-containing protein 17 [Perkinsus chesapeaki]|uniref:WD repeat-containing protein 17 n=1 Tax=Perkinsus chesapeaki TaxID=330153 RepID=A0A7J6M2M9_PERCH|nr:WD repeat-containing protein 17 [Perkinsus chesapeaki]
MDTLATLPAGAQSWHKSILAVSRTHLAYLSTLSLNVIRICDLAAVETRGLEWGKARDEMLAAVIRNPHAEEEFLIVSSSGRSQLVEVKDGRLIPSPTAKESFEITMPAGSTSKGAAVPEILIDFDAGRAPGFFQSSKGFCGTIITLTLGNISYAIGRFMIMSSVVDLAFDPLSTCYLIVAYGSGELSMLDMSSTGLATQACRFQNAKAPIRSISWQCGSRGPGSFFTASGEGSTILQLWNVSKQSPIEEIKVHKNASCNIASCVPGDDSKVVTSLRNGAVEIVDVKTRSVRAVCGSSHRETVFDCCFHPRDPNLFCTGSYDGTVRLWRVKYDINAGVESTAEVIAEMSTACKDGGGAQAENGISRSIVYGIDFSFCGKKVAGVTSRGELHVWRLDTGHKVLFVPPLNVYNPSSFRVSWLKEFHNSPRSGWIAFGRTDFNAVIVDQLEAGRVIATIDHRSPVIGIAWKPFVEGLSPQVCTAAQDGTVRVWAISASTGTVSLAHCLRGHEGRAFNVLPNPRHGGIIASGGDDSTVRVWRVSDSRCLQVLRGHTSNVRALAWHSELPTVLLSGSWDSTIRIWDAAMGCCLHVHRDHAADVYGIASHPLRPFIFISTSRDSTIKFSTTEWLGRLPFMCSLLSDDPKTELAKFISDDKDAIREAFDNPQPAEPTNSLDTVYFLSLHGTGSADLLQSLQSRGGQDLLQDKIDILSFFAYRKGIEDLADVIRGILGRTRRHDGPGEYVHESDLQETCASRAFDALAAASGKRSIVGVDATRLDPTNMASWPSMTARPSHDQAAELFLVSGDFKNYCETVASCGKWEAAIAAAPAVSLQYWQQLSRRYADFILASRALLSSTGESAAPALPYLMASGCSNEGVELLLNQESHTLSAVTLGKTVADGRVPAVCNGVSVPPVEAGDRSQFLEASGRIATSLARSSWTRLQACGILLGAEDVEGALALLCTSADSLIYCGVRDLVPYTVCAPSKEVTAGLIRIRGELKKEGRGVTSDALQQLMN